MQRSRSAKRGLACAAVALGLVVGCARILGLEHDVPRSTEGGSPAVAMAGATLTAGAAAGANEQGGGTDGGGSDGAGAVGAGGVGSVGDAGGPAIGAAGAAGGNAGAGGMDEPECTAPSDCPGVDNACAKRTCRLGACGWDYADQGFAADPQVEGDCQKRVCNGLGDTVSEVDDSDVPDDGNPCRLDKCSGGMPAHPPASNTTLCGEGSAYKCDGMGACGACTKGSDCGLDNLCATYECVSNKCKATFVPSGMGNLANTAGDCKKNVCDGMGGPVAIADASDLPDDANPCTKDTCSQGAPGHSPEPNTKSCGQYRTCNGANSCVCSDPPAQACPRVGAKCGTIINGCGEQVTCPNLCNDGINTCNGAGNPNACGCTPRAFNCGSQCTGSVSDGCGRTKDCTNDCQLVCPDNCGQKYCSSGFCACTDCNG